MSAEFALDPVYRGQTRARSVELQISGLAGRQYGVVSRTQLLDLGIGAAAIERRLSAARLHRLHPGVYAVGHRSVSREGLWLAAVLRGGRGTVLSHRSAAALWGIGRGAAGNQIEITSPRRTGSCPAIRRHYARHGPGETTVRKRIPVTSLARTLLDLAALFSVEGLEAATREAEYLHRFQPRSLVTLLEQHSGQRGTRTLRECLRSLESGPRGRTRSRLEVRFAALLARTDLPRPELNAPLDLGGRLVEADCLWRHQRTIVELDGGRAHRTRSAFEADRERDRRLQAAGWKVIRVTWRQLDEPETVLRDLRQVLDRR